MKTLSATSRKRPVSATTENSTSKKIRLPQRRLQKPALIIEGKITSLRKLKEVVQLRKVTEWDNAKRVVQSMYL